MPPRGDRVLVIGAGMGGLAAAADLARAGCAVTVLERGGAPGGKMRRVEAGGQPIDAGPTVFTMRWIFDSLFEAAGRSLEDFVTLHKAQTLARHAWAQGGRLDLFADIEASAEAIGDFAGAGEARGYRTFCQRSAAIFATLKDTYIAAQRPNPVELVARCGLGQLGALWRTAPFSTLWRELHRYFSDPRLRQLFGRYATYCGSSPLAAPATLMLVAHVEQDGVWLVDGGIHNIAKAMQRLGEAQGAAYRYNSHVSRILTKGGRASGVELDSGEVLEADAIVFNGDISALATGLLGHPARRAGRPVPPAARSLSAVTWCLKARTRGFPLLHHTVFFAEDYPREFARVFKDRTVTDRPTVYICAQDRAMTDNAAAPEGAERLLMLINAPADGDRAEAGLPPQAALGERTFGLLADCGLEVDQDPTASITTTPQGFEALFPASGGALYGRANHGAMGSFARPGAASKLPGLYLAGGSAHPGPGVPMAAMSGRLAAARLLQDSDGD